MKSFWNKDVSKNEHRDPSGPADRRSRPGSSDSSELRNAIERVFYNHRKYFIIGYAILFLSIMPAADAWRAVCWLTSALSVYFLAKGFALRNVLLLHRENLIKERETGEEIEPHSLFPAKRTLTVPQKAMMVDGGEGGYHPDSDDQDQLDDAHEDNLLRNPGGGRGADGEDTTWDSNGTSDPDAVWEVNENDYISTNVPSDGITVAHANDPFSGPNGSFFILGKMQIERYMILFIAANLLFFGGYFGIRILDEGMGILILLSIVLLIASIIDKILYGVKLYPAYRDMADKGLIFDPDPRRIVPAYQWFDKHLRTSDEEILNVDSLALSNWKPHSYTLTNKGIYLEERTGLYAGKKFLYIPLLSLKGMKPSDDWINKEMLFSIAITLFWAFAITPGDAFFWFLILIACGEFIYALHRAGYQIKARALNLTFALSRQEEKHRMHRHMLDIDDAHKRRMDNPDAENELQSYAWMEEFTPCPGLKGVKKSVRSASTGIILPTFFLSMMKLIKILDQDTSGFIFIVYLFGIFAMYRILTAVLNVWKYQKFLERPEKGSLNLGFIRLSISELLILVGYLLLGGGLLNAISQDLLTLAYVPGILGGVLIWIGRYASAIPPYNSTFKGIDYQEKVAIAPKKFMSGTETFMMWLRKRMVPPTVAFVILLVLMSVSQPYFGESGAELPDEYLGPQGEMNWEELTNESEDLVGLMGMFSLTVRVYEDDAEDGNGYPAVFSVLTMKFPVTPDEEDMLDQMKKFLKEMSEEQRISLDEPPIEGKNVTHQGYTYIYFIYNGTAANGTSTFSKGEEMRTIVTAYKVDSQKAFVITVGMAKVSDGRLVDVQLPPPLDDIPIPNPTDTRDFTNWNELVNVLIPNVRI